MLQFLYFGNKGRAHGLAGHRIVRLALTGMRVLCNDALFVQLATRTGMVDVRKNRGSSGNGGFGARGESCNCYRGCAAQCSYEAY